MESHGDKYLQTIASCCPTCGRPEELERSGVTLVGQYAAYKGQRVKLTFRENQLFELLLRRFGQIVHRDVIWSTIWNDTDIDPKIVEVYVCKINKKIFPLGLKIKASWGIGKGLFFADPVVANVAETIQIPDTATAQEEQAYAV